MCCWLFEFLAPLVVALWPYSSKSRLKEDPESQREYEFFLQKRRAAITKQKKLAKKTP